MSTNNIKNSVDIFKEWSSEFLLDSFSLVDNYSKFISWLNKGSEIYYSYSDINKSTDLYFQTILAQKRAEFIKKYIDEIYVEISDNYNKALRVDDFLRGLSELYPGLLPDKANLELERSKSLFIKEGIEISIGYVISEVLHNCKTGKHLIDSMRFPLEKSRLRLEEFNELGFINFSTVRIEKKNGVGFIYFRNYDYLNAEDIQLITDLEEAVDVLLLDPSVKLNVIRGDLMKSKKYLNKRVFCSGINLTKLVDGELPFLFFINRELGLMNKIYRGLLYSESTNDIKEIEKPWVSVIESHAIGGGAQLLLVSDIIVAETGSYITIPARKEGFIPGLANLRLKKYFGYKLINELVNFGGKFSVDSQEGLMLVDKVFGSNVDKELNHLLDSIKNTGINSMVSNKKVFRIAYEPEEIFREYMSVFSREQVRCMFDEEILNNLKAFWSAKTKN